MPQANLSNAGTVAELDSSYMEDYDYSGYEGEEGEDFDSGMMEGTADQSKGRSDPPVRTKEI